MSAAPSLPPDYREPVPPQEPPRKRRTGMRVLKWIGIGILGLLLLVVVAVVVLLRSDRVHRYVLAQAQQRASAALGSQVEVRDFALGLSLSRPTLDLYDVTIYGAPPHPTPPLLVADRIHAGVTIVSLLKREWHLNDVRIEHPVVRVAVDKNG